MVSQKKGDRLLFEAKENQPVPFFSLSPFFSALKILHSLESGC